MENTVEAIIELQTKLSFQEDLMENLNQVIIDQQGQITKLARTLEAMMGNCVLCKIRLRVMGSSKRFRRIIRFCLKA